MSDRTLTELRIRDIRTDGGTQARAATDQDVVENYTEALRDGATFPALIVFFDGRTFWLADGFHRLAAYLLLRSKTVWCEVRQGSLRDAVLFSVGANRQHGLQRTPADKRYAVGLLLADKEWSAWNNEQIRRACGVSAHLVRTMRIELSQPKVEMRIVERSGTVYTMDTSRMKGRNLQAEEAVALLERRRVEARDHVRRALTLLCGDPASTVIVTHLDAALAGFDISSAAA